MKYICDPHVIPAIMPRDFADLERLVSLCSAFTPWVHLDIMDGAFAPNPLWPLADEHGRRELKELASGEKRLPDISYEVHLMTNAPQELGETLAHAGVARLIGHLETFSDGAAAQAVLTAWKSAGAKEVGMALRFDTPLTLLDAVVNDCDVVQLMSIRHIGFQGQEFDDGVLSRLEELHANYPGLMVAVDGGVSEGTVETLVRAGANRLVVGSAIMRAPSPAQAYQSILTRAMRGCMPGAGEKSAAVA